MMYTIIVFAVMIVGVVLLMLAGRSIFNSER